MSVSSSDFSPSRLYRIPGTTGQDIYNRVKSQYFNGYSLLELEKMCIRDRFKHYLPGNWRIGRNFLNPLYEDSTAS